jgi:hypothetical protein
MISHLIASFLGESVIGHAILAGNIACKMLQFAKELIVDVSNDIQSSWILYPLK